MALMNYLGKKITVTGQGAIQKAKDISEVARINTQMDTLQKDVDNTCYEIGKVLVKQYAGLEAKVIEEKLNSLEDGTSQKKIWKNILSIKEMEAQIAACEGQLKEIKRIIHCPNCGKEVSKDAKFCGNCGILIESEEDEVSENRKICPECGTVLPEDAKFCHNCGMELEETSEFVRCPACGHPLSEDAIYCDECGLKVREE